MIQEQNKAINVQEPAGQELFGGCKEVTEGAWPACHKMARMRKGFVDNLFPGQILRILICSRGKFAMPFLNMRAGDGVDGRKPS